jgi:hypothetical protein
MTLTGPDRDEVFMWDPSEPELMKEMIMAGVQIQMPIKSQSTFNPCSLCQTKDDPCQYRKNLEPGKDCIMRVDL